MRNIIAFVLMSLLSTAALAEAPSEAIAMFGEKIDLNAKEQPPTDEAHSKWIVVYASNEMWIMPVQSHEECLSHAEEINKDKYTTFCSSL